MSFYLGCHHCCFQLTESIFDLKHPFILSNGYFKVDYQFNTFNLTVLILFDRGMIDKMQISIQSSTFWDVVQIS